MNRSVSKVQVPRTKLQRISKQLPVNEPPAKRLSADCQSAIPRVANLRYKLAATQAQECEARIFRGYLTNTVRRVAGQRWRAAFTTLAAVLAVLLAIPGATAAEAPQPGRFLLIFETSPVLKKNLPLIRQTLNKLFSSNLQNEIQNDDDLAVWTVDQSLHREFPLASWSPGDAEMYVERLDAFLKDQPFTRHAAVAAVQPLLNRVAKTSERLTVLIFCDSQSRLLGTPYDSGVNEMITNTAARIKGGPIPLILVLRASHGEYVGCSVNRSATLSFPKFPPPAPPTAEPTAAVKPAPVPTPVSVVRPAVSTVPSLIIVGTNASTNVALLTKPASVPAPTLIPARAAAISETATMTLPRSPAPTNEAMRPVPAPAPEAKVVSVPPLNPAPIPPSPAKGLPAPLPTLPTATAPERVVGVSPPNPVSSPLPPAGLPSNLVSAVVEGNALERGSLWPWAIGGGALAAAGLILWLTTRARRPGNSLITSTLQDAPPPPRK